MRLAAGRRNEQLVEAGAVGVRDLEDTPVQDGELVAGRRPRGVREVTLEEWASVAGVWIDRLREGADDHECERGTAKRRMDGNAGHSSPDSRSKSLQSQQSRRQAGGTATAGLRPSSCSSTSQCQSRWISSWIRAEASR